MTIEQELFAAYRANENKLIEYGFDCFNGLHTYHVIFHKNEFEARITIDEHGTLSGKVVCKSNDLLF